MKKNEVYKGLVTRIHFPNKGYVKVEGEDQEVMVKNTLPGQEVSFRCKKTKKKKAEGLLLEVVKPADIETQTPPCPHFEFCGGCSYETLPYEEQKNLKLKQVQELMWAVDPGFPLDKCLSSPEVWEYRNKMEFSFGDEVKDGPLTLGLHKRGSFYDIVGVNRCQIVHEDIRLVLEATCDFYQKKGLSFYHKMSHEGLLRHLLVRRASKTGQMLVCLVTSSQGDPLAQEWKELLLTLPIQGEYGGILHMINDGLSDMVRADQTKILYGQDYFYEELLGLKFKISPFSFFQTNSLGAEVLYDKAREYMGDVEGNVIFDLYSGTGTIAQVLAPVAKKVIGVEIVEEAVEAARENAKLNGLDNCSFHAGDVLKVIDDLQEVPDTIVLDPPREGVHPKAILKILAFGVKRILYISCKPTSLARDLQVFLDQGYKPVKAECVDMFPWTRGVETIVLFERQD
ncbi:MAG: 23S rRNA (uracil(1939)-C(5))-methyltransferase RlmD [Eubacterium sp.]|nr:23S rRNA (uracil(1939)-C(5))-methyltransferase RlmD [Eubacterium sp.]